MKQPASGRNVDRSHDLETRYEQGGGGGKSAYRPSLLDEVLSRQAESVDREQPAAGDAIERFMECRSEPEAARMWLGEARYRRTTGRDWIHILSRDISRIEALLEEQVNVILHHPEFQKLEAAWRSLEYLLNTTSDCLHKHRDAVTRDRVEIKLLNVTKRELLKSFNRHSEIDGSEIFKRVYEEGFGTAGASPFGLLVGDYQFTEDHEDITVLSGMAGVAATSFAPFIAAADPSLLGQESFSSLDRARSLDGVYAHPRFLKWNALRKNPDSRFLGLTLPNVLMRAPYNDDGSRPQGFRFQEEVHGELDEMGAASDQSRYLWGNAAFPLAAVVIRSFIRTGWFADIRGSRHGSDSGGIVNTLPSLSFDTESTGCSFRPSTNMILSDYWEVESSRRGFIPLVDCHDSPFAVFRANGSVFEPPFTKHQSGSDQENERLSGMLQYILCASRFAHHLKAITQTKIGTMASIKDLQNELNGKWLQKYVSATDISDPHKSAQYPLRSARLEISQVEGQSGRYHVNMELQPHYQLDNVDISIKMDSVLDTRSA
ncbi:MAG: type VI secretion system contractile sheath large subunit [Planctomycetaceae bacterium]